MPTYDYECGSCGHTWELFQSITAKPVRSCPECAKRTARRLIGTGAGILFKGSGFYQTDYRSESYKQAAKADSGGDSSAKSDTAGKSDASAKSESSTKSETAPKPDTSANSKASKNDRPKKGDRHASQ